MKHKQEILNKDYSINRSRYDLVLNLFEQISVSDKNYIPKIRKTTEHNLIAEFPGITYYKKNKSYPNMNSRYQLEWSLELGYASFIFLETYFKIKFPANIKDYEKYLIDVRNAHESKTKRHGNINLIFSYAIRSSIILANYFHKTKFNKVLIGLISNQLEDYRFELLGDLKYCIPHVKLSAAEIFQILESLRSQKKLNYSIVSSFEDYLQNNQHQLQSIFDYFSKKKYPDILGYIYTINYNNSNYSLFTDRKNRKARFFAISRINFSQENHIEKAIDIAKRNENSNKIMCIRIFKNITESELATSEHREKSIERLKMLLVSSIEDQAEVLDWILRIKSEHTFNLLNSITDEKIEILIDNINSISEHLWFNGRKNKKLIEILYKILKEKPETDIKIFKRYIDSLERKEFNYLCTWILNSDNNKVCSKIRDLSHSRLVSRLELSEEYLNNLDYFDLKYIANKIIAFVSSVENLTGLTFDLLKSKNADKKLDKLVANIFNNYLLFNYHHPKEYLKEIIKNGKTNEKKVARLILKEEKKKWNAFEDPEMIQELRISGYWLREYNKMRIQNLPSTKPTDEFSISQLFQNVELKAGKHFTARNSKGQYSNSSGMNEISTSFEMPRGEFIDPIGQQKIRIESMKYIREQ